MKCGYQCHEVGGPWIAENPDCPIHGLAAQSEQESREEEKTRLKEALCEASTVEDLSVIIYDMLKLI